MNYYFLFLGAFILYISYKELAGKETDTDTLEVFDIYAWFSFTRDDNPLIYWILILIQITVGLGLIIKGFIGNE